MPSPTAYSVELPYLGAIFLGKSPLNLMAFQKPLRELYVSYNQERIHVERRIIISDSDLLIFEHDAAVKGKRALIYSNFESIVDIQLLKLSIMVKNTEHLQHKIIQAAFLPIGYERQQRFDSLYSKINKSQYNILSRSAPSHSPLILFVMRKSDAGSSSSLLDCHVFDMLRESTAFDMCGMMRKLIIKRTMSPILLTETTLVHTNDKKEESSKPNRVKYLRRNRPAPTMEYQYIDNQSIIDQQDNHLVSNVNSDDVVHSTITNDSRNPFSSSPLLIHNIQHPPLLHDTSQVLPIHKDVHHMSSPCSTLRQRHFIKASSQILDESDEIVNDLLNIVAIEQIKSQASIKRQASFDQTSYSDNSTMNKKRYFHNKKRLTKPLSAINNIPNQQKLNSMADGQLFRPQMLLNHYGDIGNYVPKFLRESVTMRSSDSNENIFFRSTNGQLLNGFLKLDIAPSKPNYEYNNSNNHCQSTPCLNQDQNIYSLVQQLRNNQTKPFINIHQANNNLSNPIHNMKINPTDDDHRVSHVLKSREDVMNGIKVYPFISNSNIYPYSCKPNVPLSTPTPKRTSSFSIVDTELPIDYRQYLRHTDQGAYLYGEEQRQQQQSLEHSLGYFP